jgi:hypothetical protein
MVETKCERHRSVLEGGGQTESIRYVRDERLGDGKKKPSDGWTTQIESKITANILVVILDCEDDKKVSALASSILSTLSASLSNGRSGFLCRKSTRGR